MSKFPENNSTVIRPPENPQRHENAIEFSAVPKKWRNIGIISFVAAFAIAMVPLILHFHILQSAEHLFSNKTFSITASTLKALDIIMPLMSIVMLASIYPCYRNYKSAKIEYIWEQS